MDVDTARRDAGTPFEVAFEAGRPTSPGGAAKEAMNGVEDDTDESCWVGVLGLERENIGAFEDGVGVAGGTLYG